MTVRTEWRAHIGAHKTATTHLQQLLTHLDSEVHLPQAKILPMSITRPALRYAAADNRSTGIQRRFRRDLKLRFKHARTLRQAAKGAPVAILSEEDTLGWSQDQLGHCFYPNLSGLRLLKMISEGDVLRIYLSVRSYHTLLPSAFFESYKVFPDAPERLRKSTDSMLAGTASWVELLERISMSLPAAEINFWTQEDYAQQQQNIVERFVGQNLDPLPDLPRPKQTASPNADALLDVSRLDPDLPMRTRHRRVEEIYQANPRGRGPEPEFFSAQEMELLKSNYARDLKILSERYTNIGMSQEVA